MKKKGEYKFRIEQDYLCNSKEEAKEQFITDIANNNFEIEEVTK